MNISPKGLEFLKEREGYKEVAYRDEGGVWTIGYGTTWIENRRVKLGDVCTKAEAQIWLLDDIRKTEEVLNLYVKKKVNQNQYDSLVSLTYNIGIDAFKKSSLLKVMNKRVADAYGDLFFRWNKITVNGKKILSNGLLNRRKLEYALFIED